MRQFFQVLFKIETSTRTPLKNHDGSDEEGSSSGDETEKMNDSLDDNDSDSGLKLGSSKLLLTAVGIGYQNLTKTLI